MVKRALLLLVFVLAVVSCAPAVPWDQMPGNDLYGGANSSRMTANAALQQAQWQEQAMTATAQAGIVPMTQTAAAVTMGAANAQATSAAGAATQAGAMTATAIWWTPTPNIDSTATFAQLNAQNTAIANAAERDRLELERQQSNNAFRATMEQMAPLLALVLLAGAIVWLIMLITRRQRFQPAKVDARGNVLPILDLVEGTFTDVDRSPNHRGPISNDLLTRILALWVEKKFGVKGLLPEITAQRQDATTERDQMIDLATRGLPGPSSTEAKEAKKLAGQQMMKQLSDSNLQSRFRILDGSSYNLDAIDGETVQVLDQEWKEVQKK